MVRSGARGWVAVALVALAAAIAQSFGRFTYSVLLPAVRDDLGLSNTLAGLLGTVNVAAYLLGTLLVVRATARLRLMTLMRIGLLATLAGLVTSSLASSGPALAVGLLLMGLGGAAIWIPSPSIAASAVRPERRGLAVGAIGAGIGIGIVSAGQLATVLRASLGDEAWQAVYRIEAFAAVVVAAAVIGLLRPADDPRPNRIGSGLAVLRTMDGWAPLVTAYAAFGASYLMALTYLTARLEDDAGFAESTAASMFALSGLAGIAGGVLLGSLTDRIGPRRVLVLAFSGLAVSIAAVMTGILPIVAAASALLGMTFSGIPSVIAAYIVQQSDADTYGARYAVATLAFGIAQVTSPQLGGFLADLTGSFTLVFVLSSGLAAVGAAAAWRLPRTSAVRTVVQVPPA